MESNESWGTSESSTSEEIELNNTVTYHYVPAFDSIKPSSFLAVIRLDGVINIEKAAALLEIILESHYGAINALKYGPDIRRGLVTTNGVMQNMIMIKITIPDGNNGFHNLGVNIGPSSLHIPGLRDISSASEAIKYLLINLKQLQAELQKYDMETHQRVINFLIESTRGILTIETYIDSNGRARYMSSTQITQPPSSPSDDLPVELYKIYQRPLSYVRDWNSYALILRQFLLNNYVFTGTLNVINVHKTNFLYNYALGYEIERLRLVTVLNGYKGFRATFVNEVRNGLKVTLPCKEWVSPFAWKKGKQDPAHSFNISEKGKITQNSPCEEEAGYAYYQLMAALVELGACASITP